MKRELARAKVDLAQAQERAAKQVHEHKKQLEKERLLADQAQKKLQGMEKLEKEIANKKVQVN